MKCHLLLDTLFLLVLFLLGICILNMGNTYKLLLTTFLKLKELVTNFLSAVGKVGYSAMVGGNCENL